MKKSIVLFAAFAFALSFISAQPTTYIDTSKSVIQWKGSHLFSFGSHYGTVKFKEGELEMNDNNITGGNFIIDMNTIINTDGEYSKNLVDHLKNEDFFDVEKHPTAQLTIVRSSTTENGSIEFNADLTIKGITNPIQFYAKPDQINPEELKTRFIIDRSLWDITYGARSITNFKDGILSDAIEFEVFIVLNKN